MSENQRVFGIELDEHGTPQLSEAAAKSDQSSHKNMINKIRADLMKLGNEHPKSNIVVVIESGYSGKILIAEARHCSNDKVWQDDIVLAIIKAMKLKSRNADKPLSEFNYAAPQRAGLEDTLAEAVRKGILGNVMRRILLDVAEEMVKNDEKDARKSEFATVTPRRPQPLPEPFTDQCFQNCRGEERVKRLEEVHAGADHRGRRRRPRQR